MKSNLPVAIDTKTTPRSMKHAEKVAGVTGLEPAASGVTGRRSNQLSYTPFLNLMVGDDGIEPPTLSV